MQQADGQPNHHEGHWQRQYEQAIPVRRPHHGAASPVVHVLKSAIMLAPLVASEFVKDAGRAFKWSRIAMGGAVLLDQVDYAIRCHKDKEREQSWADRTRSSSEPEHAWSR
ncbi:MAG: hypothetical protein JO323_14600 [Acidobacteriia bacterium]|nr:hypothetical protein [Terriglobia bacterium]